MAARLAIFVDNATSTNKNRYLFAWAMEIVKFEHIHIRFMIAGHTKFTPDRLFLAMPTKRLMCSQSVSYKHSVVKPLTHM